MGNKGNMQDSCNFTWYGDKTDTPVISSVHDANFENWIDMVFSKKVSCLVLRKVVRRKYTLFYSFLWGIGFIRHQNAKFNSPVIAGRSPRACRPKKEL